MEEKLDELIRIATCYTGSRLESEKMLESVLDELIGLGKMEIDILTTSLRDRMAERCCPCDETEMCDKCGGVTE